MTTQYVNERHAAVATDELEDAQQEAIAAVKTEVESFLETVPTKNRGDVTAIANSLDQAVTIAKQSAREIEAAQNNLDIHPDGRKARANTARVEGQEQLQGIYSAARIRAEVLSATLEGEALTPPQGAAEAALARQDAALALGIAKDPVKALGALAKDPDLGVAALVAGTWGRRYLTALGAEDIPTTMDMVRRTALENIATNGEATNTRTQAAQARLDMARLNTVITGYETLTAGILR